MQNRAVRAWLPPSRFCPNRVCASRGTNENKHSQRWRYFPGDSLLVLLVLSSRSCLRRVGPYKLGTECYCFSSKYEDPRTRPCLDRCPPWVSKVRYHGQRAKGEQANRYRTPWSLEIHSKAMSSQEFQWTDSCGGRLWLATPRHSRVFRGFGPGQANKEVSDH